MIEEKYNKLKEKLDKVKGQTVSTSWVQRAVRVGYVTGVELLNRLVEDGLVESFDQWVGESVNGVKTKGKYIKRYRVL